MNQVTDIFVILNKEHTRLLIVQEVQQFLLMETVMTTGRNSASHAYRYRGQVISHSHGNTYETETKGL